MKTLEGGVCVVYPVPLDTSEVWNTFKPYLERFVKSWKEFPPGHDCFLVPVLDNGVLSAEVQDYFGEMDILPMTYRGYGCDAGSWQFAARHLPDCFMVCCTSRVYFHRAGWLTRLMNYRKHFGEGLYTAYLSRQFKMHACLRFFGIDSRLLRDYPLELKDRSVGPLMEVGQHPAFGTTNPWGSLYEWVRDKKLQTRAAYWSACPEIIDLPGAQCMNEPNTFRRGDQTNCLAFDRHTDGYETAGPELKELFEKMSDYI